MIKYIINKLLNQNFRRDIRKISYAQSGEDMILNCIFNFQKIGFYIDIGANHPIKASNTYYFYKKGWKGINIDACPDSIKLLNKKRKKDINIEAGISDKNDNLDFYIFKDSSYNTFNSEIINDIKNITALIEIKKIAVTSLASILTQYKITSIDFMSVDVEGFDLKVLKSNNWNIFRPKIVLVEDLNYGYDLNKNSIFQYMNDRDYIHLCKSLTNSFYIEKKFFNKRFENVIN